MIETLIVQSKQEGPRWGVFCLRLSAPTGRPIVLIDNCQNIGNILYS